MLPKRVMSLRTDLDQKILLAVSDPYFELLHLETFFESHLYKSGFAGLSCLHADQSRN